MTSLKRQYLEVYNQARYPVNFLFLQPLVLPPREHRIFDISAHLRENNVALIKSHHVEE